VIYHGKENRKAWKQESEKEVKTKELIRIA